MSSNVKKKSIEETQAKTGRRCVQTFLGTRGATQKAKAWLQFRLSWNIKNC